MRALDLRRLVNFPKFLSRFSAPQVSFNPNSDFIMRITTKHHLQAIGLAWCLIFSGTANAAVNLVVNGDFSAGDVSFSTNYTRPLKDFLDSAGDYTVGTNPQTHNENFASFGDHTTGLGKMLVLNGASQNNYFAWFQDDIPVTPYTDYQITFWAASAYATNPATLKLMVNYAQVGEIVTLSTTAGQWQEFTFPWRSGQFGSRISVGIIDTNLVVGGNDFTLDDISVTAPEPTVTMTVFLGCGLALRRRR